jgi:hypothetical protein
MEIKTTKRTNSRYLSVDHESSNTSVISEGTKNRMSLSLDKGNQPTIQDILKQELPPIKQIFKV